MPVEFSIPEPPKKITGKKTITRENNNGSSENSIRTVCGRECEREKNYSKVA
jgi:hypothetical protein